MTATPTPTRTRTLVLGGGFGGLAAATELARLLPEGHEVTLVDAKPAFSMGFAKLQVLDGRRARADVERPLRLVERHGVRFEQARVTRIDVAAKRVETDAGPLAYDRLVVALGARTAPEEVPGMREGARDLYTLDGAEALRADLDAFPGGDVLFVVAGAPFKCPPAPYEAAMLTAGLLRRRGVQARVRIATPEPQPLPVAGPACGDTVTGWVEERGVEPHFQRQVTEVDPTAREVRFADGTSLRYDLLAAVPPHRAPRVLAESGLTDASGWIPVDARTLETRHPDVWAVGDCTLVKLANGKPLVKAGVMAEGEGLVVARRIAARVRGEPETATFDGKGHCFLELGEGLGVEVKGDFYATPAPVVAAGAPTRDLLRAKAAFEAERMDRWLPR